MPTHFEEPPSSTELEVDDPVMSAAARLAQQLAESWQRGVCCPAEQLLSENPDIAAQPRAALRIVYEEVYQRELRGQDTPLSELRARFPRWQDELEVLLNCHRLMAFAPQTPQFPEVGARLGEFRLRAELGRGSMGRVYLAEQDFLAGRLMIVKLTALANLEHLKLARLQHTHIVPLYSVRDFPERHLRLLCMPCLGGATLQQLLQTLRSIPPELRTGRDLLNALPNSVADSRLAWPLEGPNQRFLEQASYVQAVCWIGVCLADGLHYAHEQGLVHLDVKPGNVLLTADFQPMLLDFHLAHGPVSPHGPMPPWLGGTRGYMSPEQFAAWRALSTGQPITQAVDARSDVYALGVLLREMLFGTEPEDHAMPARPDVTLGLRDILARCLHTDPAERYPTAAAVADDLRRHLTQRSLVGVRNRSLRERWQKWRRRRPHALLSVVLGLLCLGALGTLLAAAALQAVEQRQHAEAALLEGQRQLEQGRFADAVQSFERGLQQTNGGAVRRELEREHERAERGAALAALHRQVECSRYLHGDDLRSPATVRALAEQCRSAWEQRERLLATGDAPLAPALEEELRHDLLDTAILWADCLVRLARNGTARQEALALLNEAEALLGPSPVLNRQREALGAPARADEPAPRTAWEQYTLGRWLLRAGNLDGAAERFELALAQRPQDFWPWFGKGLVAHRRQHYADAVTAFSVCIALAPENAVCYYNRALALAAHGKADAALADYDRALQLDPQLAAAALNRGALRLEQQCFAEAEADFRRALALGADPAAVYYDLALVHQQRQNPTAALADLERALQHNPEHSAARLLRDRLQKERTAP